MSDITPAPDSPLALELVTNPAPPGTSLGLYAIGLLARADFPWEELPFGPGGIDATSYAQGGHVTYTLQYTATGFSPQAVAITATLPQGAVYVGGTAHCTGGTGAACAANLADPTGTTSFAFSGIFAKPGETARITFEAAPTGFVTPGQQLGAVTAALAIDGVTVLTTGVAPVNVTDPWAGLEPERPEQRAEGRARHPLLRDDPTGREGLLHDRSGLVAGRFHRQREDVAHRCGGAGRRPLARRSAVDPVRRALALRRPFRFRRRFRFGVGTQRARPTIPARTPTRSWRRSR